MCLGPLGFLDQAVGQSSPWYEGFEGPDVSWRPVGGNAPFRVELHQRIRGEAHTGQGCERLRIVGGSGSEVYVAHEAGYPRVIDDLLITVWVKADRPGMQVAARVVLPQSSDPQTHRPLSTILYGTTYSMVGRWQQLRVEDVPRLLTREVHALRTQYGPSVDIREAYVERILLNVYGGPGATNVWIDDLDIAGHVPSPMGRAALEGAAANDSAWVSMASNQPSSRAATAPAAAGADRPDRGRVKLANAILLVDERPVFPRIIQYQGESLVLLRQLGFNAVWLSQRPDPAMLEEAKRLGLWLIAPPPFSPEAKPPDAADAPRPLMGAEYDGVLAWDLGRGLCDRDVPTVKRWADQVRSSDRRQPGRPTVCGVASDLSTFGRGADIFVLGRSPLASSLDLSDYGVWLREQPQLTRPGIPIWSIVQTQPADSLRRQWAGFGVTSLPATFSSEQIQLLVYTALWSGSRGLVFESFSPLSGSDPDTRTRALTLELLNLHLQVAEPWMASGTMTATVAGSERGLTAAVFQGEHGRLLVPLWSVPASQYVSGQGAGNGVTFIVPGVPESYNAYQLGPGGLRPLRPRRQTGGERIAIDELDLTSMILLTENPLLVTAMTRRVAQASRRWAELERELAAAKLRAVGEVVGQLPARSHVRNEAELLASAQKNIAECDALLGSRDDAGAFSQAVRALRGVRVMERATWERCLPPIRSPVSSPCAVTFATLPRHMALMESTGAARPGSMSPTNLLPGGDFEDFGAMTQAGWRHFQHPTAEVQGLAELAAVASHSGRFGLRLAARPATSKSSPLWIDSPPVWITTPPVPVTAGQILYIHGWIQVPQAITSSVDGLLIVDSLGGEPLAERVRSTTYWQEFGLYRAAPQSGTMTVTFALTGLGEALLDDITVRTVTP